MPDKRWHPAHGHPGQPGDGDVPAAPGHASPSPAWCEVAWLEPEDWDAIDRLLAGPAPSPDTPSGADPDALATALDRFRARGTAAFVAADRLANDLLDLWAAARPFGPGAARPAEELLSALGSRNLISGEEVLSVCHRTSQALADA